MSEIWSKQEKRLLAATVKGDLALRWIALTHGQDDDASQIQEAIEGLIATLGVYDLLGLPEDPPHLMLVRRAKEVHKRLLASQAAPHARSRRLQGGQKP